MADRKDNLTPKQRCFVDEYLKDLNARQAAIRAGYSATSAHELADRLLKKVEVRQAIETAMQKRSERTRIAADRTLKEIARVAFSDVRDYVKWDATSVTLEDSKTLSDDAAAAVAEVSQTATQSGVSIKFKLHNKVAALDKLCKHLGLYKEKTPLDTLLDGLPTELADRIRGAFAAALSQAGAGAGGKPGEKEDPSE